MIEAGAGVEKPRDSRPLAPLYNFEWMPGKCWSVGESGLLASHRQKKGKEARRKKGKYSAIREPTRLPEHVNKPGEWPAVLGVARGVGL